MTGFDCGFLLICVVFGFFGWRKGAVRAFLVPLVWFLCLYLGWGYFVKTGTWVWPFVIACIGPFVLTYFLNYMIGVLYRSSTQKEENPKEKISKPDRFLGSVIAMIWNGGMLAGVIILFALVPLSTVGRVTAMQDVVRESLIFKGLSGPLLEKVPALCFLSYADTLTTEDIDQKKDKALFESDEYKQLMEDERLKSFYADEAIQRMIKEKDVVGLMADERTKSLLSDTEALSKLWAFANKASESGMFQNMEK